MKSELIAAILSGATGPVRQTGDQLVTGCPKCGKPDHLYVQRSRLLFYCFKCGNRGSAISEIDGKRAEWRLFLSGLGEPREAASKAQVDLGGSMYPLIGGAPPRGCPVVRATRYLAGRGVTAAQIGRYLISVKPFDGRVWFPYWSAGVMTWAVGRALGATLEPKTLDVGEDKPLYGDHVHAPVGDVFLVEGVFDHLVTPSSLALCGSGISRLQLASLRALDVGRVFVVLDPDAEPKALEVAELVRSVGLKCWPVLWRRNEKDPSKMGRALMTELVGKVRRGAPVRQQAVYLHV